jgi:hypothetical protein
MAAVNVALVTETNPLRHRKDGREKQLTNAPCTHGMHEGLSLIHIGMFHYLHALVSF